MRYVLEATWRGYRSSQDRPCHRMVITRPKAYEGLRQINFTDGTAMYVSIRPCKFREKVEPIHGYDETFRNLSYNPLCKQGSVNIMDIK